MNRALIRQAGLVRDALLAGDAGLALGRIDDLTRMARRQPLDPATREALDPALAQLRDLAQASLDGARQAAEQVRQIIRAARSLQTYDSLGRRTVTATRAIRPQRF